MVENRSVANVLQATEFMEYAFKSKEHQ